MRDTAGFLAACADVLTEMCIFYLVAAIFLCPSTWGVALGWLLLCALICAGVFAAVLKRPRSTPVLTAMTLILGFASFGVFLLASATPLTFGYGFVMAVGAGMAVGMPLYYTMHRPKIHIHLSHLDVLVMALLVLLLCREALDISPAAIAFTVAVLFLDAATAVGLRMTGEDGSGGEYAGRAFLVALGAAVGVFLVAGLFTLLFSRSAGLTGSVLAGIGAFFAAIGGGVERFFQWLARLFQREQTYEAIEIENEIPSVTQIEQSTEAMQLSVNTTVVGIVLVIVLLAVAVAVAFILRNRKFSLGTKTAAVTSHTVVRRGGSPIKKLWQNLTEALRFRWTAWRQRNTPGGLLIRLERLGKRKHRPRQEGETMRHFIQRMDPSGGLDSLADALDQEFYGGQGRTMTSRRCRELGRYMTKEVRHG
ncbi:MAG: hypothetical protein LUC89_00210 [Oscillospiraceae bacterium]|nr:hypothetical protein [Oscillospiraceae bacterium]